MSPKGTSIVEVTRPGLQHLMKSGGYPPFPPMGGSLLRTIRLEWAKKGPLTLCWSSPLCFCWCPTTCLYWMFSSLLLTSQQYWKVRFLFHVAPHPYPCFVPFLISAKGSTPSHGSSLRELFLKPRDLGGGGEWMTGTEGGTWRDEHWVLFCMLANWTPIKNKFIIKKRKNSGQATEHRSNNPKRDVSQLNLDKEVGLRKAKWSVQELWGRRWLNQDWTPEPGALISASVSRDRVLLVWWLTGRGWEV